MCKLTFETEGIKTTIEMQSEDIYDILDQIVVGLQSLTFSKTTIENAITELSNEIERLSTDNC